MILIQYKNSRAGGSGSQKKIKKKKHFAKCSEETRSLTSLRAVAVLLLVSNNHFDFGAGGQSLGMSWRGTSDNDLAAALAASRIEFQELALLRRSNTSEMVFKVQKNNKRTIKKIKKLYKK